MTKKQKRPNSRNSNPDGKTPVVSASARSGPGNLPKAVRAGGSKRPANADRPLSVVGVGASAGGLEAFEQLLRALPSDTGMAFCLVQHLAPKHESILSE